MTVMVPATTLVPRVEVPHARGWWLLVAHQAPDGTPIDHSGALVRAQVRRAWSDQDTGAPLLDLTEGNGLLVGAVDAAPDACPGPGEVLLCVPASRTAAIPVGPCVCEVSIDYGPGCPDGVGPVPLVRLALVVVPTVVMDGGSL